MRAIELRLKGGNIKWLDYRPPHTLVAFLLALPPRIHALFAFFDRQQYKWNFLKFKDQGLGLKSSSLAVVWSLWFNIPNQDFINIEKKLVTLGGPPADSISLYSSSFFSIRCSLDTDDIPNSLNQILRSSSKVSKEEFDCECVKNL